MAFFVPGLPLGGAERHSVGLRDRLRQRGYETSLIVYGPKRSEIILGLRGAESPVALGRRGMSDVLGWLLVWRVLRQQKADVIFAINQTPAIVAAFVRLFGGTHAKIIGVFHTTLLTPKEETRLFLFKAAARLLDGLVYVSVNQKRHWEARGLRCKVQVAIVNGIDITQYTCFAEDNARCKEAIGLDGGDYVIGLLATFRPEKNHVQLVHAVAQLRQEGIPAKILFVGGDGPTRKGVIACAEELNVREYICLRLDVNDVRPFVAAFDVGVICSTAVETFSVAALEQLATGVPMVMSDIGGASEIVQEGVNGFLIEPGNTDQLVSRLRTTFDPECRRQLRSAARASVENFTMDRMVDSYERLALELSSNN
jgi:glycosyltransferase involved in cell wall biosynthesis